jgi:hypothetical protein
MELKRGQKLRIAGDEFDILKVDNRLTLDEREITVTIRCIKKREDVKPVVPPEIQAAVDELKAAFKDFGISNVFLDKDWF